MILKKDNGTILYYIPKDNSRTKKEPLRSELNKHLLSTQHPSALGSSAINMSLKWALPGGAELVGETHEHERQCYMHVDANVTDTHGKHVIK